jgi:hypothetical protein
MTCLKCQRGALLADGRVTYCDCLEGRRLKLRAEQHRCNRELRRIAAEPQGLGWSPEMVTNDWTVERGLIERELKALGE